MFTMQQLFEKNGYPIEGLQNPHITRAVAKKLTGMGYVKKIRRIQNKNANVWMRPDENTIPSMAEINLDNMEIPT